MKACRKQFNAPIPRLPSLSRWQRALRSSFLPVAASAVLLSGCASYEPRLPVVSVLETRQQNVVLQQWDISCAAAALATILTYQHGYPVEEASIAKSMLRQGDYVRVKARGGFSLLDMKRYAESQGFIAEGYRDLTLEELQELGPAIVPIETASDAHFVVFRGVANHKVLLADPSFGNVTVDIPAFERSWQHGIGFIVTRQDGRSAPNRMTVRDEDFVNVPDAIVQRIMR